MICDAEDAVGVAVGLGRVETLLQEGDDLEGALVVQLDGRKVKMVHSRGGQEAQKVA